MSKKTIFLVDDEPANLAMGKNALAEHYNVFTTNSGKKLFEALEKTIPDLILLDIKMPEMDGYEIIKILKNKKETEQIPVIFITALSSSESEEKGLLLGAADYINKPFRPAIVNLRVRNQLKIIEQMRVIERFSEIDQLTGIPNRRSLDKQLSMEWGKSIRCVLPVGFLMIDVDKFKVFNDTYGHQLGDLVLQIVAKVFECTLKRSGDFVARYGGEEFCVLLPNSDLDVTVKIAEIIRKNIEKEIIPCADGSTTNVTVSIGAHSQIPTHNDKISEFIAKADTALYAAKKAGRNRVCKSVC